MTSEPVDDRLAANLRHVEQRIAAAAEAVGRSAADVTLVAVSKLQPSADVAGLAALGIRAVQLGFGDVELVLRAVEGVAAAVDPVGPGDQQLAEGRRCRFVGAVGEQERFAPVAQLRRPAPVSVTVAA